MNEPHQKPAYDLTIVIPVLNEVAKVGSDILSAAQFCHDNGIRVEIIISDDGSTDGTAAEAELNREHMPEGIGLVILESGKQRGKGYAVRRGMLAARGAVVMFADSGGNVAWKYILGGIALINDESCQIVHGSRKLPNSNIVVSQPLLRRVLSGLFQGLSRLILPISDQLTDTQCGFKFYRAEVARILYRECILEGFLFDLEIILRAKNEGFAIREIPLDWRCDRDSRLRLQNNFYRMAKELIFLYQTFGGNRGKRLQQNK